MGSLLDKLMGTAAPVPPAPRTPEEAVNPPAPRVAPPGKTLVGLDAPRTPPQTPTHDDELRATDALVHKLLGGLAPIHTLLAAIAEELHEQRSQDRDIYETAFIDVATHPYLLKPHARPFVRMWVAASQSVTVRAPGADAASLTLTPGWNVLDLPGETQIVAVSAFSALMCYSFHEIMVAGGSTGGTLANVLGQTLHPVAGSAGLIVKPISAVAVTAGTPVTVWTPAAGKRVRLLAADLGTSVAGGIILKDGGAEFLRVLRGTVAGAALPPLLDGYLSTAINNAIAIDVTASASVSGFLAGVEE